MKRFLCLLVAMVTFVSVNMTTEAKSQNYYEHKAEMMLEELNEEIEEGYKEDEDVKDYIKSYAIAQGEVVNAICTFTIGFEMMDNNTVTWTIIYDLYDDTELATYWTLNGIRVDETDIDELYPEI